MKEVIVKRANPYEYEGIILDTSGEDPVAINLRTDLSRVGDKYTLELIKIYEGFLDNLKHELSMKELQHG